MDDADLRRKFLEKLKCTNCTKYLSYFPIYFDANQNVVCGRCQPIEDQNFFRNDIYEMSMKYFKFPCAFTPDGCTVELIPKHIPQHEDWCEFRKIHCPALNLLNETNCDWQGDANDIYEHFEQNHPKLILQDGKFEADFTSNYLGKFMYAFGQDYFIVTKSTDSINNLVTCTVTYVGSDPRVTDYNFKITLKNANGSKKVDVIGRIGGTVQIDGTIVMDLLDDPLSIIAEIDVYENEESDNTVEVKQKKSDVNYDMIEGMKCLVCSKYMLPPIYQCQTGHCVCSDCVKQIKECPKCQANFNSTQNFALAQVIGHMIYPCTYERCDYSCKPKDIRKHEATCFYRPEFCPVEESTLCEVKPIRSNICKHLLEDHSDLVLLTNEISCNFDQVADVGINYIIPYGEKLFVLHYKQEYLLEDWLSWNMQLINPTEGDNKKYKFAIDFEKEKCRIYASGNCSLLNDEFEEYEISIPYLRLSSFCKEDEIFYRVRILEENKT